MKDNEKANLWRGFKKRSARSAWTCLHCSAIVDDPEVHAKWHKDLLWCLIRAAI